MKLLLLKSILLTALVASALFPRSSCRHGVTGLKGLLLKEVESGLFRSSPSYIFLLTCLNEQEIVQLDDAIAEGKTLRLYDISHIGHSEFEGQIWSRMRE